MRVILFGATGMLGRYILKGLEETHEVISIIRSDYDIENDDMSKLEHILSNILQENVVIINSAGLIPHKNNNDLKKNIKINCLFPHKLSSICSKFKCNLIHITTDCVFSGLKGNYDENDVHDAESIYGISKSLGEPEEATIIRTSIIGEELYSKKSLLEWVISNKGSTIEGYTTHYWNGVTCLTLSNIISKIVNENLYWKGVKHIASPEMVSKFQLCEYINQIYDLNLKIVPIEKEYKNLTLKSDNIFKTDSIYDQIDTQKKYNIC